MIKSIDKIYSDTYSNNFDISKLRLTSLFKVCYCSIVILEYSEFKDTSDENYFLMLKK